ncbi:MAG: hypothetical protein AAFU73_13020 [Planctomycetota bacterium]
MRAPLRTAALAVFALVLAAVPAARAQAPAGDAPSSAGAAPDGAGADESADDPAPTAPPTFVPRTDVERQLYFSFTDNYVAVIGNELITQSEVLALSRTLREDEDPTVGRDNLSPEKALELRFSAALEKVVEQRLKASGGRNLGFEPEFVDQARRRAVESQIQRMGGAARAGAALEQSGFDARSFEEMIGERLFSQVWEDARTGRGLGPGGRRVVDPYVRPGRLYAFYRDSARSNNREARALLGEREEQIVLQRLLIAVPSPGEEAKTVQNAEALRTAVLNDVVEFDQAIAEYAAPQARGKESEFPALPRQALETQLARLHGAPEALAAFFEGAHAGDLSPVFEGRSPQGLLDYVVVYRVARVQGATTRLPFVDPGLQQRMTEKLAEKASELQVERGLAGLARSTFVLPFDLRRELLDRGRRVAR